MSYLQNFQFFQTVKNVILNAGQLIVIQMANALKNKAGWVLSVMTQTSQLQGYSIALALTASLETSIRTSFDQWEPLSCWSSGHCAQKKRK